MNRFIVGALALPVIFAGHTFVITEWWRWFAVPHGLPQITILQAFILVYFIKFMANGVNSMRGKVYKDDTDSKYALAVFLFATLVPAIEWGIGWTLNYFFPAGVWA